MISSTFKNKIKQDLRKIFKKISLKKKIFKVWVNHPELSSLLRLNIKTFYLLKTLDKVQNNHLFFYTKNRFFFFTLKTYLLSSYMLVDITFLKNSNTMIYSFSCLFTNNQITVFFKDSKLQNLKTITNSFLSANWVEREVSESTNVNFSGLSDSRRLLTDYGQYTNSSNTLNFKHFDLISGELYIGVLRWFYLFTYLTLSTTISLVIFQKSLFQVLIISESLIVFLTILCGCASLYLNSFILIGFSLILLIFGGLELALNLLILILKC